MANALFYLLSAAALGFGVRVVTARSPLISVLSLLGTFACLAVVYLLLGFQFLAAAQLLVYAGAIMVLFLFVIMLLNLGDEDAVEQKASLEPAVALGKGRAAWAAAVAAGLAAAAVLAAGSVEARAADPTLTEGLDPLTGIATVLFSRYMLPFEAASLLLLAVMVGVVVLAKRQRGTSRARGLNLGGPPTTAREEGAAR